MDNKKYLIKKYSSLKNKTIAITGASGCIGTQFCFDVAFLDSNLILIGRNINKLNSLKENLLNINKNIKIDLLVCDFLDMNSVKELSLKLKEYKIDYFIHNAGAYFLPKENTIDGFNNVFQINTIVPYYLTKELIDNFKINNTKVICVNSITSKMHKVKHDDIEGLSFKPMGLYGNSKRCSLISLVTLFKINNINYSFVHPGVSYTNITSNYKTIIHKLIKYPMKIIFISNKKAALNLVEGIFSDVKYPNWIGPKFFNIWGKPSKSNIKITDDNYFIYNKIDSIYQDIKTK